MGIFCLDRLQRDLGLGHLPRFFGTAMTCLLSPHSQVVVAATQSLKVLQISSPSWGPGGRGQGSRACCPVWLEPALVPLPTHDWEETLALGDWLLGNSMKQSLKEQLGSD